MLTVQDMPDIEIAHVAVSGLTCKSLVVLASKKHNRPIANIWMNYVAKDESKWRVAYRIDGRGDTTFDEELQLLLKDVAQSVTDPMVDQIVAKRNAA